jgi:hypothetical protein
LCATGQLVLCAELLKQIIVIIEQKFRSELKEYRKKNLALATASGKYLPKDTIAKSLSVAVQDKLKFFLF